MFDLIPLGSLVRMRKTRWSARCLGVENKGPLQIQLLTGKTSAQSEQTISILPARVASESGCRANAVTQKNALRARCGERATVDRMPPPHHRRQRWLPPINRRP
jgi:hypothetical protein